MLLAWLLPQNKMPAFNQLFKFKHAASGSVLLNVHDAHMTPAVALTGEYSPEEVQVFESILQPESIVLEVGGCFGLHTLALAKLCSAGQVLSLEPQIFNFQILCANIALNSHRNVEVLRVAAGAKPGTLNVPQFDPEAANNFGHMQASGHDSGMQVEMIAIDQLSFRRLDLIKLDCEGDELVALQGARSTIARCQPWIYLEFTDNRQEILDLLDEIGYACARHMPTHISRDNFLKADISNEVIFGSDMILCWPKAWPTPNLPEHWREATTDDILQPNQSNITAASEAA